MAYVVVSTRDYEFLPGGATSDSVMLAFLNAKFKELGLPTIKKVECHNHYEKIYILK